MKKFVEFIKESPSLNSYHNIENFTKYTKPERDALMDEHHKGNTTPIKINGENYHTYKNSKLTHYFRIKDNKIKEHSVVTHDNVHKRTFKDIDGDSKHIHNFMDHHIKNHGILKSDSDNTKGSKHLWKSFIKTHKNHHYSYNDGETNHDVDHKNINDHEHNIWGTKSEFRNKILSAKKND